MQDKESSSDPPVVGDHLALDLLNTEARDQGEEKDFWESGQDVLRWLHRLSVATGVKAKEIHFGELLEEAKSLRTLARRLIVQRKEGRPVDGVALNKHLHAYITAPHVRRDAEGGLTLTRVERGEAIGRLLGPVAEALAELLVEGDFELVRQCEHPDCVLWFYDRTKSHKRRWCSMALCGNRMKAAEFRKRNSGH